MIGDALAGLLWGLGSRIYGAVAGDESGVDIPGSTVEGGTVTQVPNLTPEQQQIQSDLIRYLGQNIGQGFQGVESEARRKYKEESLPQLLERFTSQGSSIQGSGVRDALLRSQKELESGLASQQSSALLNLLGIGLSPQQQSLYTPSAQQQPGFLGAAAGPLLQTGGAIGLAFLPELLKGLRNLSSGGGSGVAPSLTSVPQGASSLSKNAAVLARYAPQVEQWKRGR